ncbi:MAG: acyclic terpene utilization AtuA family protein, partial [Hyphomicrobiaceae bacterium]
MSNFARMIDACERERGPFRALSASGQLGYGIPEASLLRGLERAPHMIGCDMGSVDPGPYYLGAGRLATARRVTKRDLRMVLLGALAKKIPLIIGTAGTAGANPHLEATLDIVREIAREEGVSFKLATIGAEMPRDVLKAAVKSGRTRPIGAIPALTEAEVDGASAIVGQMGTEAFLRAMAEEPDVIIAGRACDTAIYAALPARLGLPMAPAMHMAKIIECASLCCVPGARDAMLGTLEGERFVLESMNPTRHATPMSVAAHALYEQADPNSVAEPEGVLHLEDACFEAVDEHRCRVWGSRWEPAKQLSVKIEGSTRVGARAVFVAGCADPIFIERADEIKAGVEAMVRELVPPRGPRSYDLYFRFYGLGAVGGQAPKVLPEEIGVIVECIAEDEEEARAVTASAKQYLLHFG